MKHISEILPLALKSIEQNSNQKQIEMRNNFRISEIYILLELRHPKTFRNLCTIFEEEMSEDTVNKILRNLVLHYKMLKKEAMWYSITELGTKKLNQHIDKILSKL